MSNAKMKESNIEAAAEAVGIKLKPGNGAAIASMVSDIRNNVYEKTSPFVQDAPLAVFFDAR